MNGVIGRYAEPRMLSKPFLTTQEIAELLKVRERFANKLSACAYISGDFVPCSGAGSSGWQ